MRIFRIAVFIAMSMVAAACSSGATEASEPIETIPDLAFTDTTPLAPALDEAGALVCVNVRDAIAAEAAGDQAAVQNLLSTASLHIGATNAAEFSEHVQPLVLAASSGTVDGDDIAGLIILCDELLAN